MPIIESNKIQEVLLRKRHSASHALAQAVLELFPNALLGIGPATEEGFYYDFLLEQPITSDDLPKIEKRIKEIIGEGHDLIYEEISEEKAKSLFKNQRLKLELIYEIIQRGEKLSIYKHGIFFDLCKGPHAKSFKELNPEGIKILKVSGAYWKGDEKREMLQRVYGTYFDSKEELDSYLHKIEEAKKYDHRILGKELKYFIITQEIGSGLVTWLPKGSCVRHQLEEMLRTTLKNNGYHFVNTPHLGKSDLWNISGHLNHYKEGMFPSMAVENEEYYLKPMNCPFHIQIFKALVESYRDLPIKLAEFGTVYRYERSGTLHGLTRVRGFTQDDAHIFCTKEQLFDELSSLIEMSFSILEKFKFKEIRVYLSTRPENFTGNPDIWEYSENTLRSALDYRNISYYIDDGGGAFYGPKIDLKVEDNLGREWQLSTIQLDFNLPQRFGISFTNADNKQEYPIMIHRAILGSLERFVGLLLEHFKGNLPFWLSPEQVRIITVSENYLLYAEEINKILSDNNVRVSKDISNQKLGYKIRQAEIEKVPCMIVVGEKEYSSRTVNIRFKGESSTYNIQLDNILSFIREKTEC